MLNGYLEVCFLLSMFLWFSQRFHRSIHESRRQLMLSSVWPWCWVVSHIWTGPVSLIWGVRSQRLILVSPGILLIMRWRMHSHGSEISHNLWTLLVGPRCSIEPCISIILLWIVEESSSLILRIDYRGGGNCSSSAAAVAD